MDTNELRRTFSANLKKVRISQNLTQEKLAELVDLSVQTIADIESCRTWISDKTLVKLINCLNVSPSQLFMNDNEIDYFEIKNILKSEINKQIDKSFQNLI